MSAHTPGPWKVTAAGSQWSVERKGAKRGEDAMCNGSQLADDWKANSRLIAAAPDLLDALRLAHDYLAANGWDDDPRMKPIRASIDKAEGKR